MHKALYLWVLLISGPLLAKLDAHWLEEMKQNREGIALEDHSIWKVDEASRKRVEHWKIGDELKLYPNTSTFTKTRYPYCIENKSRQSHAIEVTLKQGPIKTNKNVVLIESIDPDERLITLSSPKQGRLECLIEEKDLEMLEGWKPRQCVIVGSNSGVLAWWFSSYEYILINVPVREWIRVTPK